MEGSKGRGGQPVSDGPWRGTQWRACPLARSITPLLLSAQPEALPSTCLLLHGPKSGRVTWGVTSAGYTNSTVLQLQGPMKTADPARIPLSCEYEWCFTLRNRWLQSWLIYTSRVQLPHSDINMLGNNSWRSDLRPTSDVEQRVCTECFDWFLTYVVTLLKF
jgi:hypothetical protein